MYFDMPSNATISRRGQKEILIQGTGALKRRFTVTLACTGSDVMLKPFIKFKAKTDGLLKTINVSEKEIIITTQQRGWMDSQLMHKWIHKLLLKYTKRMPYTILVFDTFKGHLTEDVLRKLMDNNITHVTIPGGCTSKYNHSMSH